MKHYIKVDIKNIKACFSSDKKHRFSLTVPFLERDCDNTICVIGQNPSCANEQKADKTLRYVEHYVFEKLKKYSNIIMLNLYTRVDTKKKEKTDLCHPDYAEYLKTVISNNSDFFIVFGKTKNEGAYEFTKKAQEIKEALKDKNVFKLDLKGAQYAPHPGNPKILYNNIELGTTKY